MALAFTDDDVNHGRGGGLDNNGAATVLMWGKWSSLLTFQFIWYKDANCVQCYTPGSTDELVLLIARATAATNYRTTDLNLPTGSWQFLAMAYDISLGATLKCNVYRGTLSTFAVAATMAVTDEGSGAQDDDSGADFVVGDGDWQAGFSGDVALVAYYDTKLSLKQIQQQQFNIGHALFSGCCLFSNYGLDGAATAVDWSGYRNNGTVTGATATNHVPLPLFSLPLWYEAPAAAGLSIPVAMYHRRMQEMS